MLVDIASTYLAAPRRVDLRDVLERRKHHAEDAEETGPVVRPRILLWPAHKDQQHNGDEKRDGQVGQAKHRNE